MARRPRAPLYTRPRAPATTLIFFTIFATSSALRRRLQALSALAAGLSLPRARAATDEALQELLEPLLDEDIRRQLRARRPPTSGPRPSPQPAPPCRDSGGRPVRDLVTISSPHALLDP